MQQEIDVKALRSALALTQAQLGEAIGVDQSTVSNWEKGETRPRGPARKLLESMTPATSRPSKLEKTV